MIRLHNIHKTYVLDSGRQVQALKGIDLEIRDGEIFGVIGLSGAGKSTLIRIINMLERPTEGSVEVNGTELISLNDAQLRAERRRIGMIFQQFNLLSSQTVSGNVAFPLLLERHADKSKVRERVLELLKLVGLEDKADVYPSELSGGQKQRVGIARALATDPKILLCDEATSALDPKTTASILRLLTSLRKKLGLTIVIITHQMEVIKECCDRVAVLDGGLISELGSTLEIFSTPKQDLTKRLVSAAVRRDVQDLLEHLKVHEKPEEGDALALELLFLGEKANDPVIVEVAERSRARISILGGAINHIQGQPLGNLVVELAGAPEVIENALKMLQEKVFRVTVLGYAAKGGQNHD
ncbi:MAG: ATP-binding cassette domain-containing protein [Succinivibrio sp.]|nr:ATP-binding cassette domain-containing protein [Succinivibrio sp.]